MNNKIILDHDDIVRGADEFFMSQKYTHMLGIPPLMRALMFNQFCNLIDKNALVTIHKKDEFRKQLDEILAALDGLDIPSGKRLLIYGQLIKIFGMDIFEDSEYFNPVNASENIYGDK